MRVIEQLAEDRFVVQMDDYDLQKEDSIKVAHDYVEFCSNSGVTTEGSLTVDGKFASYSNWIRQLVTIHIPIREMVKFILPYLNSHKYCQEEHLITSEGKPNYCWNNNTIFFKNADGEQMAAVRLEQEEEYTILPRKVYNAIKNKEI